MFGKDAGAILKQMRVWTRTRPTRLAAGRTTLAAAAQHGTDSAIYRLVKAAVDAKI